MTNPNQPIVIPATVDVDTKEAEKSLQNFTTKVAQNTQRALQQAGNQQNQSLMQAAVLGNTQQLQAATNRITNAIQKSTFQKISKPGFWGTIGNMIGGRTEPGGVDLLPWQTYRSKAVPYTPALRQQRQAEAARIGKKVAAFDAEAYREKRATLQAFNAMASTPLPPKSPVSLFPTSVLPPSSLPPISSSVLAEKQSQEQQRLAQIGREAIGQGALSPTGPGRFRRGLAAAGRIGLSAFGGGLGILAGGLTGAYTEGIAAYQSTMGSRLEATQTLGSRSPFFGGRGATRLGFNTAEAARLQAQAAQEGINAQGQGQERILGIMRAIGGAGLTAGGGIMRREGLSGGAGVNEMSSRLSKIIALGMATGLEKARIPELLSAANDYAEKQLAISPDQKGAAERFAAALSVLQKEGGVGFRGQYGSQILSKMDETIKGAQGPLQAFFQRALGFGQGASYYETEKLRQEGALGTKGGITNVQRIFEQMQKEGYSGETMNMALSKMFGTSLSVAEKLQEIFKSGGLKNPEASETVKKVLKAETDKEALQKMPTLQIEAYSAMKEAGKAAITNAERFNKMFEESKKFFAIKETMDKLQQQLMTLLTPILSLLATYLPKLVTLVDGIFKGFSAFGNAFSSAGGGLSGTKAGFAAFSSTLSDVQGIDELKHKALKDPKIAGRLLMAKRQLEEAEGAKGNWSRQFNLDSERTVKIDRDTINMILDAVRQEALLREAKEKGINAFAPPAPTRPVQPGGAGSPKTVVR